MGKSKGGSKAQQHKPPSAKRKADTHFTTIAVAAAISSALAATILPCWLSNPLQPPPERREGAVAGQGDGSAGARGKSAHEAVIAALQKERPEYEMSEDGYLFEEWHEQDGTLCAEACDGGGEAGASGGAGASSGAAATRTRRPSGRSMKDRSIWAPCSMGRP